MVDSERVLICCGLDLKFWPAAKEYLKEAIRLNGCLDADDVLYLIKQEKMQLWGIHDGDLKAVMVTEVGIYPKKKVLHGVLIGGHEMYLWDEVVVKTLELFAQELGASHIEMTGRRGWVKHLNKFGFKEYGTVLIKDTTC